MPDFPDYEAAWEMFKRGDRTRERLVWVIEAALSDEPLYRLAEHAVVLDAGRGEFEIDGIVSQVWPLEVSDDR